MPYFVFLSLNPEKSVTLALAWATDALCLPFIVGENEIPVTAHPNFRHEDESSLWLTVLHPDGRKDPGLTAIFWASQCHQSTQRDAKELLHHRPLENDGSGNFIPVP